MKIMNKIIADGVRIIGIVVIAAGLGWLGWAPVRGMYLDDRAELGRQHAMISNGYGKLKEQTFRIAHMGDTQEWEIRGLLATIDRILGL